MEALNHSNRQPLTGLELHRLADEYVRNVMLGGLSQASISDGEVGQVFVNAALQGELSPDFQGWAALFTSTRESSDGIGRAVRQLGACGMFEQQLNEYQRKHGVSGLITEDFNFDPLGFSAAVVRLGLWLIPMPGDGEQLNHNAQKLARQFAGCADGLGRQWLRYREDQFSLEDGTDAWRYVRDDWRGMQEQAAIANHASLSAGLPCYAGTDQRAMELALWNGCSWPGAGDGTTTSWQMVHPSLADELDHPDAWWC